MKQINYQPTSFTASYANDLGTLVRNRYLTKLLFSVIFFIISFCCMIFAAVASFKHTGEQSIAYALVAFSLIVAFIISRSPANKRKLIEPLGINLEINIEDYYWLEQMCKKFPTILPDVKNLLLQNGEINFSDFERIWIKLGEYPRIKIIEQEISQTVENLKLIFFIKPSVIKQRIMAM